MNTQQFILDAFNKNDTFYNFSDFFNGKTNLLYITGFSGSGKTTLSKIAKKIPNVEVIEHDNLDFGCYMTSSKLREEGSLFNEFFQNEYYYNLLREDCSDKKRAELYFYFNEFIIDYAKKNKNKVIIIEGTRCLNPYLKWSDFDKISDINELKKSAVIIKETGILKSYYRAAKRNSRVIGMFGEKTNNVFIIIKRFIKSIFNTKRWKYYNTTRKNLKKIKNSLF